MKKIKKYSKNTDLLFISFFDKKLLKKNFDFTRIFIVNFIRLYRDFISPFLPASCRFYPSCSAYAEISFKKLGFWKGSYFTLRRILKCNPFHPGGFDPVIGHDEINSNDRKKIIKKM